MARGKRLEESKLEGKKRAHVEINSLDFTLWLLSKNINLWGKTQVLNKKKMRSIEIRKENNFWMRFL